MFTGSPSDFVLVLAACALVLSIVINLLHVRSLAKGTCTECGARLGWTAVVRRRRLGAMGIVLSETKCRRCGNRVTFVEEFGRGRGWKRNGARRTIGWPRSF